MMVREDFPIFSAHPELVYLDTAASAQKPARVIDAEANYYRESYANIHRGVYDLSVQSTERYDRARERVRRFFGARRAEEIVFVRGATEAINLVAWAWARRHLRAGDEVLISSLEHHANIVPWQLLLEDQGIGFKVAQHAADHTFDLDAFTEALSPRTKLVSITHIANATGTLVPVEECIRRAKTVGARVLIDGCQSAPRLPIDLADLDCDFFVMSGHKVYGPTGIGILYGKEERLDEMGPWQGGGDMIDQVTFARSTYAMPPYRFEAGTPNIAGTVGLDAALQYLDDITMARVEEHERALTQDCVARLSEMGGVRVFSGNLHGIVSFAVSGVPPFDLATLLNESGVAIRAGLHCAQPLVESIDPSGIARASFGIYNSVRDIDALCEAVERARSMFA
ncbi:MAG: cysteine desulfurase [Pseudomonadota bacterium]